MIVENQIKKSEETIGRSLFLLGAGATKNAGCKVSSEMLDDIFKMGWSKPEREALDFMISALHYHSSWKNVKEKKQPDDTNGHTPNIEDLMLLVNRIINRDSYLPYPITGSWADKINFLEIEWRNLKEKQIQSEPLFENLANKIKERLASWLNIGNEQLEYLCPVEKYLKKSSSNSAKLEFFTLNYDLVFEKYFNRGDVTLLDTGFTQGHFTGFNRDPSKTDFRINYYKLHGSINWEKEPTGSIKELFEYANDPNFFRVRNEEDSVDRQTIDEFLSTSILNAHIIFGQGGKFLSVDPFISILYNFKEKLEEKDIYFVIGYSFFDPYINNMLLEGLSKDSRNSKLMIVVNPQFSEKSLLLVEERKKNQTDKEHLIKNRFIDYVQNIQTSTYLSDLPEFNLTEISPNKVKILPYYTDQFFKEYFSVENSGLAKLSDELSQSDDIFL